MNMTLRYEVPIDAPGRAAWNAMLDPSRRAPGGFELIGESPPPDRK